MRGQMDFASNVLAEAIFEDCKFTMLNSRELEDRNC